MNAAADQNLSTRCASSPRPVLRNHSYLIASARRGRENFDAVQIALLEQQTEAFAVLAEFCYFGGP